MLKGLSIERRQTYDKARGVVTRGGWQVRPVKVSGASNRHNEVIDQDKMAHFLDGYRNEGAPPPFDRRLFVRGEAFTFSFQAERGIEVRA